MARLPCGCWAAGRLTRIAGAVCLNNALFDSLICCALLCLKVYVLLQQSGLVCVCLLYDITLPCFGFALLWNGCVVAPGCFDSVCIGVTVCNGSVQRDLSARTGAPLFAVLRHAYRLLVISKVH
jgi:hypothetical protein